MNTILFPNLIYPHEMYCVSKNTHKISALTPVVDFSVGSAAGQVASLTVNPSP